MHSLLGSHNDKNHTDKIFGDAISDTDKLEIVNKFNDFFVNVGNNLADQMPDSINPPIYPSDYVHQNFYLFPPTHVEIGKIITNLKITRTSINELPVKLLKRFVSFSCNFSRVEIEKF